MRPSASAEKAAKAASTSSVAAASCSASHSRLCAFSCTGYTSKREWLTSEVHV